MTKIESVLAYKELERVAREDVTRAGKDLIANRKDQFFRRVYIRAIFAFIEADVWSRKMIALAIHNETPSRALLTAEEIAIASEKVPQLQQDGTATAGSARLPFTANLRFSFRVFAAAFELEDYELDVGSVGYSNLKDLANVRHRLMHPKTAESFEVSDDETELSAPAFRWYLKALKELIDQVQARLLRKPV